MIKTMNKLPDCCANCPLNYDFVSCDGSVDVCFEFDDDLKSGRKEGCPLVEVDEKPVNYGSTKSDDPISRQDALNALWKVRHEVPNNTDCILTAQDCIIAIEDLPSSQRTGKWIRHKRNDLGHKLNDCIECGACGIWFPTEGLLYRSFCPNCGEKKEMTE